jgi:hypothetical protein
MLESTFRLHQRRKNATDCPLAALGATLAGLSLEDRARFAALLLGQE